MKNQLLNLIPGNTFLHKLTGKTKVRSFVILLVYIIMSFDLRLLLPLFIASCIGLVSLKPKWKTLKYFFYIAFVMNLVNVVLYWLVDPGCGTYWCGGGSTVLIKLTGTYYLSAQTLWYLTIRFLKMMTSFMVSVVF
ncbi:MAG: hypothetical protein N2376_14275, partial [Clostridia bacterium]|nr:hypothetical protein [Clostridia bacterium]